MDSKDFGFLVHVMVIYGDIVVNFPKNVEYKIDHFSKTKNQKIIF